MVIIDTDRLTEPQYQAELRFRCITDHFFLAQMMGKGYEDFVPRIHQPVADFYVQKKPGLPLPEQDTIKFRMHLDPRHTFKTTFGKVDTLQWVLLDPDVTILNESAAQDLAIAITNTVANQFHVNKKGPKSALQLLFPEHCVEKEIKGGVYYSPARTYAQNDATIDSTSVQSSQSGWHPWVLNPDDMVDSLNSGIQAEAKTRQAVIAIHAANKNAVRLGGYINFRGTRYHPFELYGDTLDKMDPAEWKLLIRSSLTVIDGHRLMPGEFPEEHEVILNFPELLNYKKLRSLFFEDYETFMSQQQNDPQGGSITTFSEELYGQGLMEPERITPMGDVRICWRIASPAVPFAAKWDEGVAVRISDGHAYVIDAWRGIYPPSLRAEKIVAACRKHQVGELMIEDMPGCKDNETTIMNEAHRKNVSLRIEWLPFEDEHSRNSRIKMLEPQMKSGRFSIATTIGQHTEFKRQMVHFGLIEENGLVDCASRVAQRVPSSLLREEIEDAELEMNRRRRERAMGDMVWGQVAMDIRDAEQRAAELANQPQILNPYGRSVPDLPGGLFG